MTKNDLLTKLRNVDEVQLIELLKLTSDDIVDVFQDRIEEHEDWLHEQLEDIVLNGYQEDEGI